MLPADVRVRSGARRFRGLGDFMSVLVKILAVAALVCELALAPSVASAQETGPIRIGPGVQYEFLARWDVDALNQNLKVDSPKEFGLPTVYTPAVNAVRLYRVTYSSVIPERGNKPIVASGLLAVPDREGASFPMVSYQHGTVYGKQQVPSFPDQSSETKLMISQFAGQGYVVVGADYFGMGTSTAPEGYIVKASHQQATYDMLMASRAVLDKMKIATPKLFLSGWSQGGFVTMAFLQKLESAGVDVTAAATASAPFDASVALGGFLNFPRKNDAEWISILFILSSFSFENYYGVPGLARSLFNDAYYDTVKAIYDRTSYNAADLPSDLKKLIRAEYFEPKYFNASAYGRLVAATEAYRWVIQTPVRNYYGEADEVVSNGLGRLAMTYQQASGDGNTKVEAISTGQTNHRGTFSTAVAEWKKWFDANR